MKLKNKVLVCLVPGVTSLLLPLIGLTSCSIKPSFELTISPEEKDVYIEKQTTHQFVFNCKNRNFSPQKIEILTTNVQSSEVDVTFGSIALDEEASKKDDYKNLYVNATVAKVDGSELNKDAELTFDIEFIIYINDNEHVSQKVEGLMLHEFHNGIIEKDWDDNIHTSNGSRGIKLFLDDLADDKYRLMDASDFKITVINTNDDDPVFVQCDETSISKNVNNLNFSLYLQRKSEDMYWSSASVAHFDLKVETTRNGKPYWNKIYKNLSLTYRNSFPENLSPVFQTAPGELFSNCVISKSDEVLGLPTAQYSVYPINMESPTGLELDQTVVAKTIDNQKKLSFQLNIINPGRVISDGEYVTFDLVIQNQQTNCAEIIKNCKLNYIYKDIKIVTNSNQYIIPENPTASYGFELAKNIPEGATLSCTTEIEQGSSSDLFSLLNTQPEVSQYSKTLSVDVTLKRKDAEPLQTNDGVKFKFIFVCTDANGTQLWNDVVTNVGISVPFLYECNIKDSFQDYQLQPHFTLRGETRQSSTPTNTIKQGQAVLITVDTTKWTEEWPKWASDNFVITLPRNMETPFLPDFYFDTEYVLVSNNEGMHLLDDDQFRHDNHIRISSSAIKQNDTIVIACISKADVNAKSEFFFYLNW